MAALMSLADYKAYKRITKTDSDEELTGLISSVSALIKTYCGHSFIDYYTSAKIDTININKVQNAILLNEWPIRDVTSIECKGSYLDSYEIVDPTKYYVDSNIDTIFLHEGYWPEGFGSVKITYRAGYSETPPDVKLAALDLVHHYVKEEYKERRTIKDASVDNSNRFVPTKWPVHIARVLDLYRNG